MSRKDDDEGYEFAQQAKDSSDDDTLQNASYEVMRKTKTRAPLFFSLVLRPGAARDYVLVLVKLLKLPVNLLLLRTRARTLFNHGLRQDVTPD